MKHKGSLDDLQTIITGCGFNVSEIKEHDHGQQVKTTEGAIVNWYPSTGKVLFQGKKVPKDRLEEAWGTYTGTTQPTTEQLETKEPDQAFPVAPANKSNAPKKVFVVHGHDVTLCGRIVVA